jgi:NADH dehydrogenase [ubiquinone] 1 alpha subcomplex assembly factor 7
MADVLRATGFIKGFHDALSVHLVEVSPALKQKQWHTLAGKHPDLNWHVSIEELPEKPLLVIANEFFDALPIRQFVHQDGQYKEKMIGLDDKGNLAFVIPAQAENASAPAQAWLDKIPPCAGMTVEYSEAGMNVCDTLSRHIAALGGAALVIDYGYGGGTRGDTLQAMRDHQYQDVLSAPGTADLTAHVDFDALAAAAREAGAASWGMVPQGEFLMRLGAGLRTAKLCEKATPDQKSAMLSALERLTSAHHMGELFKVVCIAHPSHPKPEGF